MLDKHAELVVKEGTVTAGDTAIIDFKGFKDGVAFEGGEAENLHLKLVQDNLFQDLKNN